MDRAGEFFPADAQNRVGDGESNDRDARRNADPKKPKRPGVSPRESGSRSIPAAIDSADALGKQAAPQLSRSPCAGTVFFY